MVHTHSPERKTQAAWSAVAVAAMMFLALVTIGGTGQRGEPSLGAHIIGHELAAR
jgi:hypothetical protein